MWRFKKLVGAMFFLLMLGATAGLALGAERVELDLKQAVELTLKQNLDLRMAEINLDSAKLIYAKDSSALNLNPSQQNKIELELKLMRAEQTYLETRNSIVYDVIKQFLQLQAAALENTIKAKQVALSELLVKETKVKVDSGYERSLELLQQQSQYDLMCFGLERAKQAYQAALWDFRFKLGLDYGVEVVLREVKLSVDEWTITEVTAVSQAQENSAYLSLLNTQVELAKVELNRARAYGLSQVDVKILEKKAELAALQYEKVLRELDNAVRRQYQLWQETRQYVEYCQQIRVQAEENYQIVQKQAKVGLKMDKEILAAEIALLQAEYDQLVAVHQYYLNQLLLQKTLGIEIGVSAK